MDTKKTVLIVEDEVPLLSMLVTSFENAGFTVLQAKDGEEGLSLSLSGHPDVILLDILMPKMDGMTMMKKLREDTWGKNAQVVVLTNLSPDSDSTIKAITDLHPAYYLVKSDIKLDQVVEKVKQMLAPVS